MGKTHAEIVHEAEEAIDAVMGDLTVGWQTTLDDLDDLIDKARMYRDAIAEEHASDL